MAFVSRLAADDACVAYLSTGLLYFCRSLATTAADRQLAARARVIGRRGFASWKQTSDALPAEPDADTLTEYVRAYGAAEDLGVRAPRMKARLRRDVARFGADELLGFDPRREAPPVNVPAPCACGVASPRGRRVCAARTCRAPLSRLSRYHTWCLALTGAYCGERYGVRLGRGYRDALRWLPAMRPYPTLPVRRSRGAAAAAADWSTFYDAAYAVTHVVYTLNDYGRFVLRPEWLPHEYAFLRAYLDAAIAVDDPDLVGEFLDTVRAFGVDDADPQVRRGYDYLLDRQNRDGSWGAWDADSLYTGFHATWAAIDGLREFRWTGPDLLDPSLLPSLRRWARVPS